MALGQPVPINKGVYIGTNELEPRLSDCNEAEPEAYNPRSRSHFWLSLWQHLNKSFPFCFALSLNFALTNFLTIYMQDLLGTAGLYAHPLYGLFL